MTITQRNRAWFDTTRGFLLASGNTGSHTDQRSRLAIPKIVDRAQRQHLEINTLSKGATISTDAGNRKIPEEPDTFRTAFERDRDRIVHSSAFRRLAGKTQVFIFPSDNQRTRLTHALEVAQVAVAVARATGLNVPLTEAIALGHDCGHGPGGHASEDAFSAYLPGGYDHASWGADQTLTKLNLCEETLDGIRNHSWSRPEPLTPEGNVVSFADRIAYCAHDLEDAVEAGIVTISDLPSAVVDAAGASRASQLKYFITDMIGTVCDGGEIAMSSDAGAVLCELRSFNYENIYMTSESIAQSGTVISVLRHLTEYFIDNPREIQGYHDGETEDLSVLAVKYVSGMTDRFAFQKAEELLRYTPSSLPRGIDFYPER